MGWRDWLGFGERPLRDQEPQGNVLTLGDVVDRYDIVDVRAGVGDSNPYIVVAERSKVIPNPHPGNNIMLSNTTTKKDIADTRELGSASPTPFTSWMRQEYNRELQGIKGLQKYDQMRKSDGTVRGTLRAFKTPVHAARWFMVPASNKPLDVKAAEAAWCALTEEMSISWTQILIEALLMADFGYYMFEKVWEFKVINGKRMLAWKKLAPRHPMDVKQWHFDSTGGPAGVTMYADTSDPSAQDIKIPIKKLLVFTFDREGSNIQGTSVLRSAYKHWYYIEQLYKIDAIQKERHGIGIPVIKLPVNFTDADRAAADDLGRNLRTNERAYITLPPNWEVLFAKVEGNPVDAMKSIEHHSARIRENIVANFLGDNTTTKVEDQTMFLKASRVVADIVRDTINTYLLPEFIAYNFPRAGLPKIQVRRIGETEDQRTASFTIRNLVGAGVIIPDRPLEEYVREVLDLPAIDEETRRDKLLEAEREKGRQEGAASSANQEEQNQQDAKGPTKQRPDKAGLPRQAKNPPVGPPAKNAGIDRSGGK